MGIVGNGEEWVGMVGGFSLNFRSKNLLLFIADNRHNIFLKVQILVFNHIYTKKHKNHFSLEFLLYVFSVWLMY